METMSMTPAFLDAREITRNCADAHLDQATTQALLDLAQRIRADPGLRSVSSAVHQIVFDMRAAGDYRALGRRWRATQRALSAAAVGSQALRDAAIPPGIRAGDRTAAG